MFFAHLWNKDPLLSIAKTVPSVATSTILPEILPEMTSKAFDPPQEAPDTDCKTHQDTENSRSNVFSIPLL